MYLLRIPLLAIDGLLLAFFLAGYVARYVHPQYLWWLQLIAVGLPLLSLGLLGATVIVALCGWWKLFSLHILLCLLALVRFFPVGYLFPSVRPAPEDMVALTFNAPYKYPAAPGDAGREAMTPLIAQEQPHLICIQGVTIRFRGTAIQANAAAYLQRLLDTAYTSPAPKIPMRRSFHQPILARIPIQAHARIGIGSGREGQGHVTVTRAQILWSGRPATIYNIHLRSFDGYNRPWQGNVWRWLDPRTWMDLRRYRGNYLARAHEAEQIKRMLARETEPFLVCGDFNSTPHNWESYHLSRGLQDAFRVAGRGLGATYHSRAPFVRIDYILASPHWQVVSARVASEVSFSDHLPLVARLRLRDVAM